MMTTYEKFKVAFMICASTTAGICGIIHFANKPYSDDRIRNAADEYCFYTNMLEAVRVSYKECIDETPQEVKLIDSTEYIKACRRTAYDINGISGYNSSDAELSTAFTSEYYRTARIARHPMSNGKKIKLECEALKNVNLI